jgi:hypothetical protein
MASVFLLQRSLIAEHERIFFSGDLNDAAAMPPPGPRGGARKRPRGDAAEAPTAKLSTTKREEAEIRQLEARIKEESPPPGSVDATASEFSQLPLSRYTHTGLERGKFRVMTQIQRIAIMHALAGCVVV